PPKRRGKTRKPEETIERPEETETSETQKDISNHDEDEFSDKKDESEKSEVLTTEPMKTIEKPSDTDKPLLKTVEKDENTSGIGSNPSVPTDLKVSTPLKTMSHSEIQATNPLKLTVVEPGQTGSSANGVFIERLTSDDTDDVKEFLKKIQELKTTHHDLIIPPFSQLMPP
ncbi:hypothetical protein ADUPG1_003507, partial [Aduncisulcus paluster]